MSQRDDFKVDKKDFTEQMNNNYNDEHLMLDWKCQQNLTSKHNKKKILEFILVL